MNTPIYFTANKAADLLRKYFKEINAGRKDLLHDGLTDEQHQTVGHLLFALKEGEPRIPLSAIEPIDENEVQMFI